MMAQHSMKSTTDSIPTLPRLLAVNKDFSNLDEQIVQVAHIIGLPEAWENIQDETERSTVVQQLARPRAEWVLRWALDKLRNEAEVGPDARANPTLWTLVDWMVHVLPVTRAATQLRDSNFLTILEKTLQENSEKDAAAHTTTDRDESSWSESSETAQEEPKPSRKRKRPSGTSTPSSSGKRLRQSGGLLQLFGVVAKVTHTMTQKTSQHNTGGETSQEEHMKVALRTESAQAARILKYWFVAAQKTIASSMDSDLPDHCRDISSVLEIWDLRVVEVGDVYGASAEQFSTECLIPTLLLLDAARDANSRWPRPNDLMTGSLQALESLIAKHVFVPSRAAFQAQAAAAPKTDLKSDVREAHDLASHLEPLRAKLLQAAQIQDISEPIPKYFIPLYLAVPQLLDIAIRLSPSRTPKARITEQPWLQSVFVALADSVGCPLEPPAFITPQLSIDALRESLELLRARGIRIDPNLIMKMFWFHTGVKYPLQQANPIQWSLIAALIELDATAFIGKSSSKLSTPEDQDTDLVHFLFEQISSLGAESHMQTSFDQMELDVKENQPSPGDLTDTGPTSFDGNSILNSIIVPIMSAFARSRDLLGFIQRWDAQLVDQALIARSPLQELSPSVWESHTLSLTLVDLFEQSLTQAQILTLFQQHAARVKPFKMSKGTALEDLSPGQLGSLKKGFSSAVLIRAMMWAVGNDTILESLQAPLLDVLASFSFIVRDAWHRKNVDLSHYWISLSQTLNVLWPLHLHASFDQQQELLLPIIDQATKDVSHTRKGNDETRIDSRTRSAALTFLLTASDHLRTVSGWEDQLQESLKRGLKLLSPGQLEPGDLHKLLEVFCTEYAQLLNSVQAERREKSILALLSSIGTLDPQFAIPLVEEFSHSIIAFAGQRTKDAFSAALLTALSQENERPNLSGIAEVALLQIRPEAFARERREEILDALTDALLACPQKAAPLLRIVTHLMRLPNATAKISTDGGVLFDIVECLHKSKADSPDVAVLLQELVSAVLGHILPNKDQTQNKRFLEKFEKRLTKSSKSSYKYSPARVALLGGILLIQKQDKLFSWDSYLTLLDDCLHDDFIADDHIVEAFLDIPSDTLQSNPEIFAKAQLSLKGWLKRQQGSKDVISGLLTLSTQNSKIDRILQLRIISKYQLCPNANMESYLRTCTIALQRQLSGADIASVLQSVRNITAALPTADTLPLIAQFFETGAAEQADVSYSLLPIIISTLGDGLGDEPNQRTQQLSILPRLGALLATTGNTVIFNSLLNAVNIIIRDKPSLTNQNGIESVIATIANLTSRNGPALPSADAPAMYSRLCETSRLILLLHRGRLGGRFHLLLPLLQNLLFCLFIPHAGRGTSLPPWLQSTTTSQVKLTPTNAAQYSRLLSTLCSPTQSSVSSKHQRASNTKSTLNDPIKAAKEYASHYVYPLLASFCRFSLSGRLEPTVRDKVITGIWEVIGIADMDRDTLDAMFSGLDKASRDVWRGIWEEWKKMNGRQKVQKSAE